jgi:predicted lipoprotein
VFISQKVNNTIFKITIMLKQTEYYCMVLLLLLFVACNEESVEFDQSNLLNDLSEQLIVPTIAKFKLQSVELDIAVQQFAQTPSEQNLEAVQNQWKKTMLVWKKCQLFDIGEVAQQYLGNRIQKWPVNQTFIEENIADTVVLDIDFIESIGATAKGLSAIEYFIFSNDLSNAEIATYLQNEPRRLDYLSALNSNLSQNASEFKTAWDDYLETFKSTTGNGFGASISLQVNEMVAVLERINKNKISKPAGLSGTVVDGDLVEAKRSDYSKALIIISLENLKSAFVSGDSKYLGFDDYLNSLEAEFAGEPLSTKILSQIDKCILALEQINEPLHTAVTEDAQAVADAREAILQLLVLVKVDLSSSLSITITFSDSDGD